MPHYKSSSLFLIIAKLFHLFSKCFFCASHFEFQSSLFWSEFVDIPRPITNPSNNSVDLKFLNLCSRLQPESKLSKSEYSWCRSILVQSKAIIDQNKDSEHYGEVLSYGTLSIENKYKFDQLDCKSIIFNINSSCDDVSALYIIVYKFIYGR